METYLVGGAVRDALLGLAPRERDWVVVGATPEEMKRRGFRPVGRDFPVFIHPETGEEYALARTERKSGHGYKGFEFHAAPDVTLEDDLARRDLSINAMAKDADGNLIDPFGGRDDLEARVLRHVSGAFVEDPLRVLRVARFAARLTLLGFRVADETMALMREIVASGECAHLVAERTWQETERALATPAPRVFLEVLRDCGALGEILPEVDALFGVPQRPEWHPEVDAGRHLLLVMDQAVRLSDDTRVRFAALVHDLGKGVTPKDVLPSHRGHEKTGVSLVRDLCERLRVPAEYRRLGELACREHLNCHRAFELTPGRIMHMLERADALRKPDRFERFLLACEADARGREGAADSPYPQADYLRRCREAAAGVDAAPLAEAGLAGAEIGERLRQARIKAIRAVPTPGVA